MASAHDLARQDKRPARGPQVAFIASVLAIFGILMVSGRALPPDLVTPVIVSLLFGLAAIVAIAAWRNPRRLTATQLNYWDVAGALVLIGMALSALIEPEQMVRLVEGDHRDP
jgi:drug/metabolite transporter (DMT)-like permease